MANNFVTFYIIRHGETDWNAKEIVQGQTDIPLNERGKVQAQTIAKELQDITFDLVFSSDLLRAKETAEIIVKEKKLAIAVTELLRERYFGRMEGKHFSAFAAFNEYFNKLSDEEKFNNSSQGVESDEKVISRMITFLRETAVTHPGKTILVATHGGVMRTLLIHLGFGTRKTLRGGSVANTAYIKLRTDGVDFFIEETRGITVHKGET